MYAPDPEKKMPIELVSMNYRYIGAWGEVNARIAQRQNAVNIYVTLASGIVTILLATARTDSSPLDPNLFSLLLPIISLVFGLLNYKHDKTIALLREFMARCELVNLKIYKDFQLPGYNSSTSFKEHRNSARKFHDLSCAFLIIVFNVVGLIVAHKAYPDAFDFTGWPIAVYVIGAFVAVGFVMRSTFWPHDFSETNIA